jgi:hypothetical protein
LNGTPMVPTLARRGARTLRSLRRIIYSVSRVRAALFNAAVSWTPIDLD